MKGGLERDEWGHPAVISLFSPAIGSEFPLFPHHVSQALLSFSFNQGNQSDFKLRKPDFPTVAWLELVFCGMLGNIAYPGLHRHGHIHTALLRADKE